MLIEVILFILGNHIFDYTRRVNKVITGHNDASIQVSEPSVCAQLCGSGDTLAGCASFEICSEQMGRETMCILSTADPTTQSGLNIVDSDTCTLYTSKYHVFYFQEHIDQA